MALTALQRLVAGASNFFNPAQPPANASIYDLARADAQRQSMSALGAGLIGAAVPQTPLMRAQALQQAFAGAGNMNTNVYNAAQARLMAQKAESEARQLAADEAWLQSRGMAPQSTSIAGQLPNESITELSMDSAASRLAQPLPPSVAPVKTGVLTEDDIRNINENIPPSERASFTRSLIRERMLEQAKPFKPPAAPSGYRNIVDEGGNVIRQEPIPGGPGTQMPAELGARIGLAESFIKSDLPNIKKSIDEQFTDDWTAKDAFSRAQLAGGFGEEGEIYRRAKTGIDALTRMMTGAGLNVSEESVYNARYLPAPNDTKTTMLKKLNGLQRDLEATIKTVTRGRGGTDIETEASQTPAKAAVDYSTYVGQGSGQEDGFEAYDEKTGQVILVSRNGKWELP